MADQDPIVKLDPGGRASILSHNVPESVIYSGRNYINLEFDGDIFLGSPTAAALFATQSAVLESGSALNTSTTSLLSRALVSRCGVNFKEHLL